MQPLIMLGLIIGAYILGSMPFGFLLVKLLTGKDVRNSHSGRTGGTNVMRTAGFGAGLATAIGDILKGAGGVWIAQAIYPDIPWIHAVSGLMGILGHNYSIFLAERVEGKLVLRGGAGGAPSVGAAMALWGPSILIIVPIGLVFLFVVGYASMATMSMGVLELGIFAVRAIWFGSPWEYIIFGFFAMVILFWSLRPNIRRLLRGEERLVGWRAKLKERREEKG